MLFKQSTLLAIAVTTTVATPLIRPFDIPLNTASCSITPWASTEQMFKVSIMRYFGWGSFCKPINETFNAHVTNGMFVFECFPIDSGASTNLTFVTRTSEEASGQVKEASEDVYPVVDFGAERWCWDLRR